MDGRAYHRDADLVCLRLIVFAFSIASRPLLALTMLAGMAAGISGFITGLLAIVKQKENALLVYVSTVIGGLLTLFLVGELAFPH